jgi:hypothetical protein
MTQTKCSHRGCSEEAILIIRSRTKLLPLCSKHYILLKKGKENLKTNIGEGQRLSIVDKGKEHDTRKELSKETRLILSFIREKDSCKSFSKYNKISDFLYTLTLQKGNFKYKMQDCLKKFLVYDDPISPRVTIEICVKHPKLFRKEYLYIFILKKPQKLETFYNQVITNPSKFTSHSIVKFTSKKRDLWD